MNENIEKVLAVLDGFRMCDEMTYSAYSALHDEISLLDDLLKAQEPRVMTLEEVCTAVQKNAILFTECEKENQWVTEGIAHFSDLALFDNLKYNNCKITFIRHTYDGTQKNEWYVHLKNYNKTWRCWTARPTDEQRKVTPWEPSKED